MAISLLQEGIQSFRLQIYCIHIQRQSKLGVKGYKCSNADSRKWKTLCVSLGSRNYDILNTMHLIKRMDSSFRTESSTYNNFFCVMKDQ